MKKYFLVLFLLVSIVLTQNDHSSICSRRSTWVCCKNNFKCCYTNVECIFVSGAVSYTLECSPRGQGCYKETPLNQTCDIGLTRMDTLWAGRWFEACGFKIN